MGFVGAGGIGQDLIEAIRKFYYSDVSAILLLIIVDRVVIDLVTEQRAPSPDRPGGAAMSELPPRGPTRRPCRRRCSARAWPARLSRRVRPARASARW